MAVYKVHKTRDYTVMSNTHLRDKSLSLKGKGLLSVMLSLPDDWDYTQAGLVAISKENETAIKNALDELKACGYLVVTKLTPAQTESGRFEYRYDIYEQPQQKQVAENQQVEKQGIESLGVESQAVENPGQLNTNSSSTNKVSTNKSSTDKKDIVIIVDYLNEKSGKSYRAKSKDTAKHINARLTEGFTVDDFKTVIDKKCAEWLGTEFEQYLRPATLFGTKFEGYLNAPARAKAPAKTIGANGIAIENKPSELDGIL